jgi:predicted unusual protein kinase regulating ubiquinone biosynthesis (AarF/ABC1/UbiB family)
VAAFQSEAPPLFAAAELRLGTEPQRVVRIVRTDAQRIVEEIWTNLKKEIDFRREAQNIRRFALIFADWPTIYVPGVIDDLVSGK